MENATIYDYARMCKGNNGECKYCPLGFNNNGKSINCDYKVRAYPDKANEIILNWCKEHPIETRQSRFLKMFPNADIDCGFLDICPHVIDEHSVNEKECPCKTCLYCKKDYWLAEVDENE